MDKNKIINSRFSRAVTATLIIGVCLWANTKCFSATTNSVSNTVAVVESADAETDEYNEYPGWGIRLLCYVPNRLLDFIDIFRVRAKIGPGLSAGGANH